MDKKISILIFVVLSLLALSVGVYFTTDENEDIVKILSETEAKLELPAGILVAMGKVESSLNPKAISPKGAKGLLQIRDATAKSAASEIGLEDYNIFDPKDNALIGGLVLKENLKRFKGDLHLALAAYNAGPTRIKKWMKKGKGLPGPEVIQAFGYKETKQYVKKIFTAWKSPTK